MLSRISYLEASQKFEKSELSMLSGSRCPLGRQTRETFLEVKKKSLNYKKSLHSVIGKSFGIFHKDPVFLMALIKTAAI
jgi:hypothetical protein